MGTVVRWAGYVVAMATLSSAARGQISFQPLGAFPGGLNSHGYAITDDGSIAVGYAQTANGDKPFRWTRAGGLQQLQPGTYTPGSAYAQAVSADGSVIVGFGNFMAASRAFRWTESTGMTPLLLPPGANDNQAQGISGDGQVIVGSAFYNSSSTQRAVRWDSGGAVHILSDAHAVAIDASFDGSIVIGNLYDGQLHAYRWDQATGLQRLPELPGSQFSLADAVSADGRVIVGKSAGQAVVWSGAGITGLGALPGHVESYASAVTPDGAVVVGSSYSGAGAIWHPFFWTQQGGMQDILGILTAAGYNLSDWRSLDPTGVSADGMTIVGTGFRYSGSFAHPEAWVAVIPAPATTVACAVGLGLRARRRPQRH